MAVVRRFVHCTFPKARIGQPVLYQLGQRFAVVPNIRGASINDEIGLVALELEGEEAEVARAIAYLKECDVETRDLREGEQPGKFA